MVDPNVVLIISFAANITEIGNNRLERKDCKYPLKESAEFDLFFLVRMIFVNSEVTFLRIRPLGVLQVRYPFSF